MTGFDGRDESGGSITASHGGVAAHKIDTVNALSIGSAVFRVVTPVAGARAQQQAIQDLIRSIRKERQGFIDQALGVDWRVDPAPLRFTDPDGRTTAESMVELLLRWQDIHGGPAGSIYDVQQFYRDGTGGRLVVLGGPGSGKSMLLSHLVRDLLDNLPPLDGDSLTTRAVVPVMLSLPSLEIADTQEATARDLMARLDEWIIARLVEDYQVPARLAHALLAGGHILPVLDGLDEMDPSTHGAEPDRAGRPRAASVIKALNHDRTRPVVLACRSLEYEAIATTQAKVSRRSPILTDARHVILQPLTATEVIAYLTDRFGGHSHQLPAPWRPVVEALPSNRELLTVLQSPWQLFLAVTAYHQRDSTPAELLDMTTTEARHHLIGALIPAVTAQSEMAALNGWTPPKVQQWLTYIAEHQNREAVTRGTSLSDIRLPELWRIGNRRYPRVVPPFVLFLAFLPFITLSTFNFSSLLGVVVSIGAIFGIADTFAEATPLNRTDFSALRTRPGRRRITREWGLSLLISLGLGPVFGLVLALEIGLTGFLAGIGLGLFIALAMCLTVDIATGVEASHSPTALVRQCITHAATNGLVFGLMIAALGLAFGSARGVWLVPSGVGSMLGAGLIWGLWTGKGYVWWRYALGVRSAARRDRLPVRPARFLDWCLAAGLMRMAGTNIQYRHREFQEWLTFSTTRTQDLSSPS